MEVAFDFFGVRRVDRVARRLGFDVGVEIGRNLLHQRDHAFVGVIRRILGIAGGEHVAIPVCPRILFVQDLLRELVGARNFGAAAGPDAEELLAFDRPRLGVVGDVDELRTVVFPRQIPIQWGEGPLDEFAFLLAHRPRDVADVHDDDVPFVLLDNFGVAIAFVLAPIGNVVDPVFADAGGGVFFFDFAFHRLDGRPSGSFGGGEFCVLLVEPRPRDGQVFCSRPLEDSLGIHPLDFERFAHVFAVEIHRQLALQPLFEHRLEVERAVWTRPTDVGILAFDLLDDALALGFEVESESFVEFLSELLGVHLVVLVVATLFARLAVLVAGLWLAHRLARLRCIAVALSYSTSIALVVFESR